MNYQEIIKKAWRLTLDHRYLVSFGTIASFFSLLIGVIRVRYVLSKPVGTIHDIWNYISTYSDEPMFFFIVFLLVIAIIYGLAFLTNIIAEGAMISSIAKIEDQDVRLNFGKSLSLAINCFLPLTKYNIVTTFFNIGHFVIYIFLVRYYTIAYFDSDFDVIQSFWPFILFFGFFIGIISLGLTYGQYNLVIHRDPIFKSIRKSLALVMFHFSETLLITILISLITIRTLINIILVIIVPSVIMSAIGYLSYKLSPLIAFSLGGTLALICLYLAAKLSGALKVLITGVWTLTFLELDKQKAYKILKDEDDDKYLIDDVDS